MAFPQPKACLITVKGPCIYYLPTRHKATPSMSSLLGFDWPCLSSHPLPFSSFPSLLNRSPETIVIPRPRRRSLLLITGNMQAQQPFRNRASGTGAGKSGSRPLPFPSLPPWGKWVIGIIACLAALPFYKNILKIEGAAEKVAEKAVETVEMVAGVAGKIAGEVAEALPVGVGGGLKEELLELESMAEMVEKDAKRADEIIHKVDVLTDEVEEALVADLEEKKVAGKEHKINSGS